jgi:hypothetical protein
MKVVPLGRCPRGQLGGKGHLQQGPFTLDSAVQFDYDFLKVIMVKMFSLRVESSTWRKGIPFFLKDVSLGPEGKI